MNVSVEAGMEMMTLPSTDFQPRWDQWFAQDVCHDCGTSDFIEDFASGDTICLQCGLVVPDRIIDTRSEWRNFADNEGDDPSRASRADESLPSGGLGCNIATSPPAQSAVSQTTTLRRPGSGGTQLARLQARSQTDKDDRKVLSGYATLSHIADLIALPEKIRLIAKEMYSAFAAKRRKMLFKKNALEAAVIYIACREAKVPRTFKELAGHTDLADKDIRHYYNMLKKALPASEQQIRSATAGSDLVNRFCSKLRLSHAVVSLAMAIADRAAGLLEGKRPSSIAAGAILLASKLKGESRSPQDIAQAASISAATVSNIYKQLIDNQATVLPPGVSSTPTPPRF